MNNEDARDIGIDEDDVFELDPSDFPAFEEPEADPEGAEQGDPADPSEEEPAAEPAAGGEEGGEEAAEEQPEERFELSDGRSVTRAELTNLANAGANAAGQLAQLQAQLDEAEQFRDDNGENLADLAQLAKEAGVDIPVFLDLLRENAFVAAGMNRQAAKAEVAKQRAAKQGKNQAEAQARAQRVQARQESQQRVQQDLADFARLYPGVSHRDPAQVPQEVWNEVLSGKNTLTGAYGQYQMRKLQAENERLKREAETAAKNKDNKSKAVGSVKSHGQGKVDPFLAGLMEDY